MNQLCSIVSSITLGSYIFDVTFILRDAMLLNSILVNCETWNYLTKKDIESLESVDTSFMKKCFNAHSKTVREAFFIETGKLPVRYILAKRRFMFWHHILTRTTDELIFKVYQAQKIKPTRFDWRNMILQECESFSLEITEDAVPEFSKRKFKILVEQAVNKKFLENMLASKKRKLQGILKTIKIDRKTKRILTQPYLTTHRLSQAKSRPYSC